MHSLIWARYSEHKETQQLIKKHNYGCVIPACWIKLIYPTLKPKQPDFTSLDNRINTLSRLNKIHLHPLVNRYYSKHWATVDPILEDLVMPIIDRYRNRVKRFTLSNELLLGGPSVRRRITDLYANVSKTFPDIDLWLGEYGLRSRFRMQGCIEIAKEIKTKAPNLKGIVLIDYIDLQSNNSNPFVTGIKNNLLSNFLEIALKGVFDGIKIASADFETALESSVFTGPSPTESRQMQQLAIYKKLLEICDLNHTEFWHWNITDQQCGIPWDKTRNATDYPGFFDRNCNPKRHYLGLL